LKRLCNTPQRTTKRNGKGEDLQRKLKKNCRFEKKERSSVVAFALKKVTKQRGGRKGVTLHVNRRQRGLTVFRNSMTLELKTGTIVRKGRDENRSGSRSKWSRYQSGTARKGERCFGGGEKKMQKK